MKPRSLAIWRRYLWFALALFAVPGITALYRWTADLPRSDSPPKPIASPANAPPVATPEVCKEQARRFAAARAHVADCHDARDCAASSALLSGDYDSTNCLDPLNPSRVTPELRAIARDYHNSCTRGCRLCRRTWPQVACIQGRCAWE
jgi:hypothetical protein